MHRYSAFREAVFALEDIEIEHLKSRRGAVRSDIRRVLERVMTAAPEHWSSHYHGTDEELRRMRCSSMLDRIRYYWGHPDAKSSLARLHANLGSAVPASLWVRSWPEADPEAADGAAPVSPAAYIRRRIQKALRPYLDACR